MPEPDNKMTRRDLLRVGARGAAAVALGSAAGVLLARNRDRGEGVVWQIDPDKCVACGNCATYCVLSPSAVKCVHAFGICQYCELCFAYFDPTAEAGKVGAEAQLCPADALRRKHVEGPYYEYTVDEGACIGCGRCVKGCGTFGEGAMYLQVRHDRCLNCNDCAIAAACPSGAFVRIRIDKVSDWLKRKGRLS